MSSEWTHIKVVARAGFAVPQLLELSRSNLYYQGVAGVGAGSAVDAADDRLHLEAISFQMSFLLC
jgi:hypothetical protein